MPKLLKVEIKEETLYVEINIAPHASKSGKSIVLSSTEGNIETDAIYNGKKVTLGLNAYIKA